MRTERQADVDFGAPAGLAFDGQASAEQFGALAHSHQTQVPAADVLGRVEALPVILDDGDDIAALALHQHRGGPRPGITRHVGQRFLDDAIDRRFDLSGQALLPDVDHHVNGNLVARLPVVRQPFDGVRQTEVVEDARAQAGGYFVHLLQRFGGHAAQFVHGGAQARVVADGFDVLQPDQSI